MKTSKITFRLARPNQKTSVIVANYYINGKKVNHSLGIVVKCSDWLQKSQSIKLSCSSAFNINEKLNDYRQKVNSIMLQLIQQGRYSKDNVLRMLKSPTANQNNKKYDVMNYFDLFIHGYLAQNRAQEQTKDSHRKSYKIMQHFNKYHWNPSNPSYLSLNDINTVDFYNSFVDYLEKVRLYSVGYMDNQIKSIKALMRYAERHGYIQKFIKDDFKRMSEKITPVFLSLHELNLLENLKIENDKHRYARDWMLVTAFSSLRVSDFMNLKMRDVSMEKKLIRWQTKKTETEVCIPLVDVIENVIKRNDGFPPKLQPQKFNDYIKIVCKNAGITEQIRITRKIGGEVTHRYVPKYSVISAHSGRRSFCTNSYNKGVPPEIIRNISGHKSIKTLMGYINIDSEKSANVMGTDWHK